MNLSSKCVVTVLYIKICIASVISDYCIISLVVREDKQVYSLSWKS